jgi:hypothetical protein
MFCGHSKFGKYSPRTKSGKPTPKNQLRASDSYTAKTPSPNWFISSIPISTFSSPRKPRVLRLAWRKEVEAGTGVSFYVFSSVFDAPRSL